jgi:hypothetical protein
MQFDFPKRLNNEMIVAESMDRRFTWFDSALPHFTSQNIALDIPFQIS